ncbi:porin [Shewanella litorisediminis]|uniref:Porin n=1 Tax=Shewanella litorisediminis TaxID=1173586 RepID=A0ABX7G087_9GAMM|nr:porin [Shewanella litorisediminis]MCL2918257.1 porin [Shewanella litorisediminis]QRH00694.1 porin [Shewanella litorisediminis]
MSVFRLSLISAALLGGLSLQVQATPDFYGRLDYSVTHSDTGAATHKGLDGTVLENNFTRLGVRGTESLTADLTLFYQVEMGVDSASESGSSKPFTARPTFIGVRHAQWGSLAAGRMEPVFKMTKGFVDVFDNYSMKHDRLMAGDKRWGDSFEYKTPVWHGWQLGASLLMEDNYYQDSDKRKENGNYQLALTFGDKKLKNSNLYLAAAYSDGVEDIKAWRAVGHWKLAALGLENLKFGTLIQQSELANPAKPYWQDRDGLGFIVSGSYKWDKWLFKAQYGKDESGTGLIANRVYSALGQAATQVPHVSQWGVGAEYFFSKSTRVHLEAGQFDTKQYADFDDNITSIGIRYDF